SSTAYKRSLNSSLLSMCYLPVDDRAPEPCYRLGQVDARVLLVADPAVVGEPAVLLEPVGPPDPLGPDALADVQPEQVDADLFAVPHNRRERTGHHLPAAIVGMHRAGDQFANVPLVGGRRAIDRDTT